MSENHEHSFVEAECMACELCGQTDRETILRAEVARLTEELRSVNGVDCECDDDMTADGHSRGCEYGITFQTARAEAAEAEVTRLKARLATVAEFIEHDDCGYCGLRLIDKRAGCAECEPVKLALGFRAPLVTEGE